jgi:molybdate/tungstate transport system substrate-binding protein
MVLMYNDKSLHSDIINSSNWYEILLKKGVEFGHSDPDADPCGYRTLMTWQLAEKYYNIEGLYKKIQQACPKKNIREKSVDLIALLQTGELDYIYEYKSVAMQHKGKFIYLPDQINLKSQKYSEFYKNAKVKISGKKPGTFTYKTGSPMIYGITILKSAENNKAALDFTKLLFGQKGRKIMEKNGQTSIYPPIIINKEKLPDGLKEI